MGSFLPFGGSTTTKAGQLGRCSLALQHLTDQINADAGTRTSEILDAEVARLPGNRGFDQRGLLATRGFELPDASLKLLARLGEAGQ